MTQGPSTGLPTGMGGSPPNPLPLMEGPSFFPPALTGVAETEAPAIFPPGPPLFDCIPRPGLPPRILLAESANREVPCGKE